MATVVSETWQSVLAAIRELVSESSFETWFAQVQPLEATPDLLRLGVANLYFKEWLEKHYRDLVADAALRATGSRPRVEFTVSAQMFQSFRKQQKNDRDEAPPVRQAAPRRAVTARPGATRVEIGRPDVIGRLNPEFRMERFVEGPSNRLAVTACRTVLESPGAAYNPLLIYGDSGLGKTHLLQGLAAAMRARDPSAQVVFCPCESFTNEYVRAAQEGKLERFRALYRAADVLIVDDLQFLAGKVRTQEEFLHAFDALVMKGGQVVLGCDAHPRQLTGFGAKLGTRLVAGLVARLDPPSEETRERMLQAFCQRRGFVAAPEITQLLARRGTGSVRELEGALVKVCAVAAAERRPADLPLARRVLRELCAGAVAEGPLTLDGVVAAVAEETGLAPRDIRSGSRARSILCARQLAMYLAKELTRNSLTEIGQFFGGRSHATVIHAHGRIVKQMESDHELAAAAARLRDLLTP